ncbi:relaxase/mobilization nuclease domain-containing protein [Mangrovicoccus algicola]|uniref:Relaxase/mobilization nuclease domain-containing protein n=1 Tax=Mangrovicoccus algicola TaxID=2771008 RepID=A0A8J7CZ09_9RHOB|nr:relaxase/mobilization nuclease domain-containing protein [Mangrovicoccus algicola]MBE3637213.1 relaxase/mobilization nuclease domain-containing protein [Mangrovicoccus algicola]
MIAKIVKGKDFGGLARYLTDGGRGEVLDMRNLASDAPEAAASEMQVAASVSRRTQSPVMHITVSYDPADGEPGNAQMCDDAAEVLRRLGLERNQAMIVRHRDREHHHMHIVANRVGPDGKAVSDSNSYARAKAALRDIETRRGLTVTPGRHAPSPLSGERMKGPRGSIDPRQHRVPESVKQTLLTSQNWGDLRRGLKRDGWRLETVKQCNRPAGAVLIGPGGQRIAAGRVGRSATLARLRSRLGPEQTGKPVSARATGKALTLAKPHGKRRKKPKAGQQMKDVARIGAEITSEIVGAITKTAAPRGRLIGATRRAGSRKKKRPGLHGPGM